MSISELKLLTNILKTLTMKGRTLKLILFHF